MTKSALEDSQTALAGVSSRFSRFAAPCRKCSVARGRFSQARVIFPDARSLFFF
jgi:hypothetical protein